MKILDVTGLRESAQSDRRMRQMAANVVRGLVASRRRPFFAGAINNQSILYLPTIYPDLVVGFSADEADHLAELIDAQRSQEKTIPDRYRFLILFPLRDVPPAPTLAAAQRIARRIIRQQKVRVDTLLDQIRDQPDVFVHEFTHYADRRQSALPIPIAYALDANADRDYYNDTLERNAFYNEMLSKIDRRGSEFYQIPFRDFLKRVTKLFDPDFFTSLERRNQQRIIQRLYGVWQAHQ